MGARSSTTFQKRQKEIARMEKQRDKLARRQQRKADKLNGVKEDDLGEPVGNLSLPDDDFDQLAGFTRPV